MSYLETISFSAAQFQTSNQLQTHMLDGGHQTLVAGMTFIRLTILTDQVKTIATLARIPFNLIGLAFLMTILISSRPAFAHWNITLNHICNYSDALINLICSVTYVSMIALGQPVSGVVGLLGIALILIKRQGYLPITADRAMEPFTVIASFYASLISSQRLLLKLATIASTALELINHFSQYNKFGSSWIEGSPGMHIIQPGFGADALALLETSRFRLNYSSFHAKELQDILPTHSPEFDALTSEQLCERVEAAEGFQLNEGQLEGWGKIKSSFLSGQFTDSTPANVEEFKTIFRNLLISLLQDTENFQAKMRDLADVGHQCNERWIPEMFSLIAPQSNDFRWAIHHKLAVFRSEVMKAGIRDTFERFGNTISVRVAKSFHGEFNNVHLINEVARNLWHRWRSYDGEVSYRLRGRTLFTRLIHQIAPRQPTDSFKGYKNLAEISLITFSSTDYLTAHKSRQLINEYMVEHYTIDDVIEHISNAIKPQYRQLDHHREAAYREIDWENVILPWHADLNGRGIDAASAWDRLVANDLHGKPHLTHDGILLLLWDLGIIERDTD